MSEKSAANLAQPGATYKLVVRSAEEAVQTIRERLGDNARVLSVRQLQVGGLAGLFGKPRLEVIAQVAEPVMSTPSFAAEPTPAASAARESAASAEGRELAATTAVGDVEGRAQRRAVEPATRLPDLLRRSGFSETMLGRLQAQGVLRVEAGQPLHHSIAEMGRALRRDTGAKSAKPLPARVAFLGMPGVGRTTALCKWLAQDVFVRGRTGRVVKVEFDRPNPADGLAVFCEAMGLTLEHAAGDEAVSAARETAGAPAAFTYADLPGLSLRKPTENAVIRAFLDEADFAGRVLVLNAVYDLATLRSAHALGRELGATHVVFTHLDELAHWGKLWDFLLDGALTPLFIGTGPSLTGDIEEDTVGAVLRRTLPGA